MANLAKGLVDAAREHDGRPALRLGDTKVSFAEVDDASARVAAMLQGKGCSRATGSGSCCRTCRRFRRLLRGLRAGGVVVPMNPLLKSREVAFYLGDSGRAVIFAFAGSPTRPRKGAADDRRGMRRGHPGGVRAALAAVSRRPGDRARAGGHGCDLLHVRHHRQAERCRADARQHVEERGGRAAPISTHRRRRDLRRPAAVPLLRANLRL